MLIAAAVLMCAVFAFTLAACNDGDDINKGGTLTPAQAEAVVAGLGASTDKVTLEGYIKTATGAELSLPEATSYNGSVNTIDGRSIYGIAITGSTVSSKSYYTSLVSALEAKGWGANDGTLSIVVNEVYYLIGMEKGDSDNDFTLFFYAGTNPNSPDEGGDDEPEDKQCEIKGISTPQYSIAVSSGGTIKDGKLIVKKGAFVVFTISVDENYIIGEDGLTVRANEEIINASSTGSYGITVNENISLQIDGIREMPEMFISISPSTAFYDGNSKGFSVDGANADAEIQYSTDGENWDAAAPRFTQVGEHKVYIKVTQDGFKPFSGEFKYTIERGQLNVDNIRITDDSNVYDFDGVNHQFALDGVPDGVALSYSFTYDGEYSEAFPEIFDAGEYRVYVKLSSANYRVEILQNCYLYIRYAQLSGITAEDFVGYENVISGSITVNGTQDGDVVEYKISGEEEWTETNPVCTVKKTDVEFRVTRGNYQASGSAEILLVLEGNTLSGGYDTESSKTYDGVAKTVVPYIDTNKYPYYKIYYRQSEKEEWTETALSFVIAREHTVQVKLLCPGEGSAEFTYTFTINKADYNKNDVDIDAKGYKYFQILDSAEISGQPLSTISYLFELFGKGYSWKDGTAVYGGSGTYNYIYNADTTNYNDYEGKVFLDTVKYYTVSFELPDYATVSGTVVNNGGNGYKKSFDGTSDIRNQKTLGQMNFTVAFSEAYSKYGVCVKLTEYSGENVNSTKYLVCGENGYSVNSLSPQYDSDLHYKIEIVNCYTVDAPDVGTLSNVTGYYDYQFNTSDFIGFDSIARTAYIATTGEVDYKLMLKAADGYQLLVRYSLAETEHWTVLIADAYNKYTVENINANYIVEVIVEKIIAPADATAALIALPASADKEELETYFEGLINIDFALPSATSYNGRVINDFYGMSVYTVDIAGSSVGASKYLTSLIKTLSEYGWLDFDGTMIKQLGTTFYYISITADAEGTQLTDENAVNFTVMLYAGENPES